MLVYGLLQERIDRAVRGVIDPEGRYDLALQAACREGFGRAFFFAPALGKLKGLGGLIKETVRSHNLVPENEAPGQPSILQAHKGKEPVSLRTMFGIEQAVMAILDKAGKRAIAKTADALHRLYPEGQILTADTIVASLYAPDPTTVATLRSKLSPAGHDRATFSGNLMQGALGSSLTERAFLDHIEDGYESPTHPERGRYKLTKRTAAALHGRFKQLEGEDFPDFEEFAPADATCGPRLGQLSRGLRPSFGNLVP